MKKAMAKQVSVTQETYDNMTEMLRPYGKNELCHLMGLGYSAFLEENSDITIPCSVVLIVGEHDKTGKVKAYNNAWAKRTGYPLFRISNAAHNSNVDNPAAVNGIIAAFLRNLK
jgi:pimeloyl-ACP methyl ester carboxylesterase